jgi:hypothetical protein
MKIGNYDVQRPLFLRNGIVKFKILEIQPVVKYFHYDKIDDKFTVIECIDSATCPRCKLAKILFDLNRTSEAAKNWKKTRYYLPIKNGENLHSWEFGKTIYNAYVELIKNHKIHAKKKNKKYKDIFFTFIQKKIHQYTSYDDCIFHLGKISKTVGQLNVEARDGYCSFVGLNR